MINISKVLTVGSLLLAGINAGSSDWEEYELGLELGDFYDFQQDVAKCGYDYCEYKEDYLNYFLDNCNICIPLEEFEIFSADKLICYESKQEYDMVLNELYKDVTHIIKWEHKIREIAESQTGGNEYGEYGYDEEPEQVYTVDVKVDKEYTKDDCKYRTCETEQFEIINGKIRSYKVIHINIKSKVCGEETTTKHPTSWEKSTTKYPSPGPGPIPPSSTPSWSPTTPSPTTPKPTTPKPTTPYPTTPAPTTPKPTTPEPTTPAPTTPKPTTPYPTTPKPTTPSPTTGWPTTAPPTTSEPTTANPTTAEPTTAEPTTAEPTTSEPTTAKPTTAEPTTAWPTTAPPTTAEPTTAKPTTSEPTTPQPTTSEPSPYPTKEPTLKPMQPIPPKTKTPTMWKKSTTANPTPAPPKKCTYNGGNTYGESYGASYGEEEEQECDYGYKCVKEDCSEYNAYDCSGICVKDYEESEY